MSKQDYRRRAMECLAFAKISRDEEERSQMLIMANTLQRLAAERETRLQKRAFVSRPEGPRQE
jgi:hypothetical protein